MQISEVAWRSGVPATTLRFYEGEGLIAAARGANGYRDFDASVLEQLSLIQGAKQLQLSLPEISELLRVVEGDSCTQVRETLRPKLAERLRAVDERLKALEHLRDQLTIATQRVAACPDSSHRCRTECALEPVLPQSPVEGLRAFRGGS